MSRTSPRRSGRRTRRAVVITGRQSGRASRPATSGSRRTSGVAASRGGAAPLIVAGIVMTGTPGLEAAPGAPVEHDVLDRESPARRRGPRHPGAARLESALLVDPPGADVGDADRGP